jgi:hypothetical protein
MNRRVFGLILVLALVASACSGLSDSLTEGTTADASASSSTAAPTTTVASPTTTTSAPATTTTTTTLVEHVEYDDPEGDCIAVRTQEQAENCDPAGTDILTVVVDRASPLTVTIGIAAPLDVETEYQFTIGLDLDRDRQTGIVEFWPEFHGIGPDLESDYFGGEETIVQAYAITGASEYEVLDPESVVWSWLDDTHIQAVFPEELTGADAFGMAVSLFTGDQFDRVVDGGHLVFPSGDVVTND